MERKKINILINNTSQAIKVSAYSGYKLNERPLSFLLNEQLFEVKQIIYSWRDPDHDFFRIEADDEKEYVLKWNRAEDEWFLVKNI